ncbi:M48 family metallopeptidase [Algoriphagus sp. AK58]|uniref:M48 family metallopeptidase n=1 Tax=Algoriphagus sp. AK58 TaxID=1406877 RepID=UPI001650AD2C|nr:M48 family metallopeptidase [Algoriphagus sp. AK58]MBC6367808.1 peptidase M48 [Algoriphagus sp. AK58]
MKKIALIFALGLFVYSCAKVPLTGRSQLALVPSSELQPLVNEEYQKALKSNKVLTGTKDGQMVARVGNKMAASVEKYLQDNGYGELVKEMSWEFNLLESDQVNAWCMPGGKVAFYTGILPITKDETGIAVVMGHEIAHAIASHARERMSNGLLLNFGVSALSSAMGKNPTLTQQIFLQSVGGVSQLGMLKFSRKHELEADEMGLIFMAMAGYDPRQAPVFWERMAAAGGEAPPEFISTHPGPDRRIERLNANMPKAMEYYNAVK